MKPGEFYKFTPRSNWCREGTARVTDSGVLVDTYWGLDASAYEYALLPDERATIVLLFDSNEYDELPRHDRSQRYRWEQFHPNDREKVSEQHGCTTHYFVRKGAKPDLQTKIENARRDLEEARSALRSAQWTVESRERDLADLISKSEESAE